MTFGHMTATGTGVVTATSPSELDVLRLRRARDVAYRIADSKGEDSRVLKIAATVGIQTDLLIDLIEAPAEAPEDQSLVARTIEALSVAATWFFAHPEHWEEFSELITSLVAGIAQ
jgi:chemotaxis methyl-accepting protein methylase